MILSDRGIEKALESGRVGVDPEPANGQIQPASLDVRLGKKFHDPTTGQTTTTERISIEPNECLLGTTLERVSLPNDLAAQLTGRSTLGRRFVQVHQTAGWIDPGFNGTITLEIVNCGNEIQTLNAGDRVAQLVFSPLDQPSTGYEGQYQGQESPQIGELE